MTPECVDVLSYVSQAFGLISAFALVWASLGVSSDIQSWRGKTPLEVQHKRRQRVLMCIGLPSIIVSVGCQTAITVLTP